jgi:hypothetical protein
MLGSPDAAFRTVKDHGTHGIGTPQWIDSLSGAKGRVPVRDFASDDAQKGQSFSDPLTVTVDSEVDSAHYVPFRDLQPVNFACLFTLLKIACYNCS